MQTDLDDFDDHEERDAPLADPDALDESWFIPFPEGQLAERTVAEHCKSLFADLEKSCLFNGDEECYVFPTGMAFMICTNWADLTRRYFGEDRAIVVGYLHEDNEGSKISEEHGGHDFVILDDRYIIDGWLTGVSLEQSDRLTPGVYDLENDDDASEIARLYGNRAAWEPSGSCHDMTKPLTF